MAKVVDYFDVKKRALELDCAIPNSLAILPRNFENAKSKVDLVHENTTPTIRILWRQNNIVETPLEKKGENISYVFEESFGWVSPLIFFTSVFIIQNPYLIDVAIGVISNYLTDWFKGISDKEKKVSLNIVEETRSGSYKKIDYSGPLEGLQELPAIIRSIHDEQ